MKKTESRHWTERIFVDKPYLFLPFLSEHRAIGDWEAAGFSKLFKKYGLCSGGRILDLCCGIGRTAVPLAKLGYNVVGVDLSPDYIRRARRYASSKRVSRRTRFLVGDYRDISSVISKEEPFDGVMNTYTSMGYYGKNVDLKTFVDVANRTVAGGVFVLKTMNRDWIVRHFERKGWEMAGNVLVLEDRKFDFDRSYMVDRWEYYRVVGMNLKPEGVYKVDHRVYSPAELRELMESTGWKVRLTAANLDCDRIDLRAPDHSEVVIVGKRR